MATQGDEQLNEWRRAGRRIVHEADTKRLFEQCGIAVPRPDPLTGGCAVKLCSDRFPHKTEHGLVKLDVPALQAIEVGAGLVSRDEKGTLLIEEMVLDGMAEWIVGCRHDSTFGPIIIVGVGGVMVELLKETKARLVPIDAMTARRAITSQRAARVLEGLRGKSGGDIEALVRIVTQLSEFFARHSKSIEEIEINPIIVRPPGLGAVAADALMVLRPAK